MAEHLNEVGNLSLASVRSFESLMATAENSADEARQIIKTSEELIGQIGEGPLAVKFVEQRAAAKRRLSELFYFIGQCRTHFGDNIGSVEYFISALDLDKGFSAAAISLGRAYVEIGRYRDAVKVLNAVNDSNLGDPRCLYFLARANFYLRQVDAADYYARAAIKAEPDATALDGQARDLSFRSWEQYALHATSLIHEIARWRQAVKKVGRGEGDVARLKKIAKNRPLYITAIEGRGWVLSHMVSQIEPFLRQLSLDGVENPFVIVINSSRFCNPPLVQMYQRAVWMVDDRYPRLRRRLIAARELLKQENSPIAADIDRHNPRPQVYNQYVNHLEGWLKAPQVIHFSDDEKRRGASIRAELGLNDGDQHICFGVRETSYYREAWKPQSRGIWSPQGQTASYWEANVDHESHPLGLSDEMGAEISSMDSSITQKYQDALLTSVASYIPMARHCAGKGLYVLRMGANVDEALPNGLDPRIIDYAKRHRSDFGDIYWFANCKFTVAGGTGITWIPAAFGRPFIVTDLYLPNNTVWNTHPGGIPNLFLPRLYWYADEKRYLKFSESFKVCRYYQNIDHCQADGIENTANTPEALVDVVDEMNDRVDGVWQTTPEDEELQKRFRALIQPHDEGYRLNGRIGAKFLREHADLVG